MLLKSYQLPLLIGKKLITSKSILATQFRRSHNCLHSGTGNSVFITKSMTASSCLLGMFISFYTFSELK